MLWWFVNKNGGWCVKLRWVKVILAVLLLAVFV